MARNDQSSEFYPHTNKQDSPTESHFSQVRPKKGGHSTLETMKPTTVKRSGHKLGGK